MQFTDLQMANEKIVNITSKKKKTYLKTKNHFSPIRLANTKTDTLQID